MSPILDEGRWRAMSERVGRTLTSLAVPSASVLAALNAAMSPRHARLDDDHDPRYLHPGRTVLVAAEDGGVRDPELLCLAALLESFDPELRIAGPGALPMNAGGLQRAVATAEAFGEWNAEDRAEALVTADTGVQVVAVCEWLDQIRHLRHWADPETLSSANDLTRELYLPLAGRVSPLLHRRLEWWLRRVVGER
jgi:hypothetical protein